VSLTSRELQVLTLLAVGAPNRTIATELVVSLDTVKKRVSHVLGKIGAANRARQLRSAAICRAHGAAVDVGCALQHSGAVLAVGLFGAWRVFCFEAYGASGLAVRPVKAPEPGVRLPTGHRRRTCCVPGSAQRVQAVMAHPADRRLAFLAGAADLCQLCGISADKVMEQVPYGRARSCQPGVGQLAHRCSRVPCRQASKASSGICRDLGSSVQAQVPEHPRRRRTEPL
jgi:DNA-binding CsgD family transcriptional regulator